MRGLGTEQGGLPRRLRSACRRRSVRTGSSIAGTRHVALGGADDLVAAEQRLGLADLRASTPAAGSTLAPTRYWSPSSRYFVSMPVAHVDEPAVGVPLDGAGAGLIDLEAGRLELGALRLHRPACPSAQRPDEDDVGQRRDLAPDRHRHQPLAAGRVAGTVVVGSRGRCVAGGVVVVGAVVPSSAASSWAPIGAPTRRQPGSRAPSDARRSGATTAGGTAGQGSDGPVSAPSSRAHLARRRGSTPRAPSRRDHGRTATTRRRAAGSRRSRRRRRRGVGAPRASQRVDGQRVVVDRPAAALHPAVADDRSSGTSKTFSAAPPPRSMTAIRGWSPSAAISKVMSASKASA